MNRINGLDKKIIQQIIELVIDYKKPEKIILFGSRAGNVFRKTSDIDIAVFGRDWTSRDINLVRHLLDECLKTPLKIDVLNFYELKKDSLKESILKEGKVLYER